MDDTAAATGSAESAFQPGETGVPDALPDPVEIALYGDARRIDELVEHAASDHEGLLQAVRDFNVKASHALEAVRRPLAHLWPRSLFIPAGADWRSYWVSAPPDSQRYKAQWLIPGPEIPNVQFASADNGTLGCYEAIRPFDRLMKSEAGVGVFYSPEPTLSVVSIQPTVTCTGAHRWRNLIDHPLTMGDTWVRISLIIAAWQVLPLGQLDLVRWREVPVVDTSPQSGLGEFAISLFSRSFSGADLATTVLVERGRSYLMGVVARVLINSTLTDTLGHPIPENFTGRFNVWGLLSCRVPEIDVFEQTVYIP